MMNNKQNTLKEIIERIQQEEILLPNFQRNYVWNDLDKQKRLLASYFCALPIGTLLLLWGEKNEFSTRRVGSKKTESSNSNDNVRYLLDGQQRITTLSNIFSNIIFENIQGNWNNFISHGLKRRFFLKITKENDLFGLSTFSFPWNVQEDYPPFSVNDICDIITSELINKDDNDKVYHPNYKPLQTNKNDIISWYVEYNVIPLFLIYNEDDFKLLKKIIKGIANNHYKNFDNLDSVEEFQEFYISENLISLASPYTGKDIDEIKEDLSEKKDQWIDDFMKFFDKLRYTELSIIDVPKEQRGRAIEIYENINLGGVTLNEFDLLTARAAKIKTIDVQQFNLNYYNETESLPEYLKKLFELPVTSDIYGLKNKEELWIPIDNFNIYDDKKNSLNKSIIQQYLKLLNIFNKLGITPNPTTVDKNLISQKASLELDAPDIYRYTELSVKGISRACAFLQLKCGLLNISELNYDLMLVPLAYILSVDTYFNSSEIMNKLQYWYWGSIFSGRYNTDQTEKCATDIKNLIKWINGDISNPYAYTFEKDLFKLNNFSDDDTILLKKANFDITPKQVIISSILKFILIHKKSRDLDIKSDTKEIIQTSKIGLKLEIHHIIPLAEYKKIGESTKVLRQDKTNFMNCVGNLTLITNSANGNLSSLNPSQYFSYLEEKFNDNGTILETHCISNTIYNINYSNENEIKDFIENRYKAMKNYISTTIENFLN